MGRGYVHRFLRAVVVAAVFIVPFAQMPFAKADTVVASLVRTIDASQWNPASPDPAGIAYLPGADGIMVADSEVDETTGAGYHGVNVWLRTRTTDQHIRTFTTTSYTNEPTGLAYDAANNRLFISSDSGEKLFILNAGNDGLVGTSDDQRITILLAGYGITDAEDVAYNPQNGHAYVADGTPVEVWDIDPVDGILGNGNDTATSFDVAVHGGRDAEGLAYDSVRNTILVADRSTKRIYELTTSGALVRTIDARGVAGIQNPADVEVAPASNGSGARNYWIADRTVDNGTNSSENDGLVFEVSIPGGAVDAPPSVTLTAPAAGATVSGTSVALAANASDDNGVTKVEWFLDGTTLIATDTSSAGGWTGTWNSTQTTDGSHTITARATDTIGQTANHQRTVTVDNIDTPPSVTLTAPGAGATVSGTTVALAANASDDNGVTKVEWFLDGSTLIATDTSSAGGWTGSWDSTSTSNGPHTITARATDTIGQTANHQRSVTVDNVDTPPSVTLTAPAAGATVSGTAVALSANASDNNGVTKVEWFLDGGTTPIATDSDSAGGWTGTWDSTQTTDGSHTITARATDTIGQTADDQRTVTVDNIDDLPSVTLTAPAAGATVSGTSVALAANASDDKGVTKVEWFLDGGTTPIATDTSSVGGWTGSWDSTSASYGSHTITARATDTIDQTADDTHAVGVDNDAPPSVELQAPAQGSTVSGAVNLEATASDDNGVAQVEFILDGSVSLGTDVDGSDGWTGSWDSTLSTEGSHTITARATDTVGKTASDQNTVTVDNVDEAPTVNLTIPQEDALVRGSTLSLAANASDDKGIAMVEWFLDGGTTPIDTDTSSVGGWTGTWDSTATSDGPHSIAAVATDTIGQTASSAVSITVDNTPPTDVHVTSPVEGQSVVGTVTVMASATDAVSVQFFRGVVSIGTDTNGSDGWSVPWNTAGVSTGALTLTATATDAAGNQSTSPGVTVTVDNPIVLDIAVATGSDDAEQKPNRNVIIGSADLDFMTDTNVTYTAVGLRFTGVSLPADATVTEAYVQFTADEARAVLSDLEIAGEKALNPGTFSTAKSNITNRAKTDARASWSSTGWLVRFARTEEQRTPDLSAIVEEIIGQSGWTPGNAMVFVVTGDPGGRLVANAFEGGGGDIPVLHIEYTVP